MKDLAYPLTDKRSFRILLVTVGFHLATLAFFVGGLLCILGMGFFQASTKSVQPHPAAILLGFGTVMAFQLGCLLVAILYFGYLVAANREGWKRSGRLPELRWGTMLKEGAVAIVLPGLVLVVPYLAMSAVVMASLMAVFGLSGQLSGIHHSLGVLTNVVGLGGVGLGFMAGLAALIVVALFVVPLLQARYAATGKVSSYFRWVWAVRTLAIAPGKFLLYAAPTALYILVLMLLHFLTLGLSSIPLGLFIPFLHLNQAYLVGHYYGEFVDPSLGAVVPESARI
jgi:hypothetical protein